MRSKEENEECLGHQNSTTTNPWVLEFNSASSTMLHFLSPEVFPGLIWDVGTDPIESIEEELNK